MRTAWTYWRKDFIQNDRSTVYLSMNRLQPQGIHCVTVSGWNRGRFDVDSKRTVSVIMPCCVRFLARGFFDFVLRMLTDSSTLSLYPFSTFSRLYLIIHTFALILSSLLSIYCSLLSCSVLSSCDVTTNQTPHTSSTTLHIFPPALVRIRDKPWCLPSPFQQRWPRSELGTDLVGMQRCCPSSEQDPAIS